MRFLQYKLERCNELLQPFVKFYTYIKFEPSTSPMWIPADRRNQILFLIKGEVELQSDSHSYKQSSISLRPVFNKPITVHFSSKPVEVVNIEFTPIGLYHLFEQDLTSYINKISDVEGLFPPHFVDQLNQDSFKEVIDSFLLAILKKKGVKTIGFDINEAINMAENRKGKLEVKDIPKLLDVHSKKFYRYFRKYTGLAPKQYFSILQFEAALLEILKNEKVDKMDLINKSGYYDQPHFIKTIQKFTGSSPDKIKWLDKNWLQFLIENKVF